MTILEIILLVFVTVAAVAIGFLISTLIELKRTASQATIFLSSMEKSLSSTLEEASETLKNIRGITENVNAITSDVRSLSSSVKDVSDNVKGTVKRLEEMTALTSCKLNALKAGLFAGLGVFIKNFFTGKGGSQ